MEAEKNSMKSFINGSYGDGKLSKDLELNESMSIKNSPQDEYTRKIMNIGGSENA